jgi:hypothetical protein
VKLKRALREVLLKRFCEDLEAAVQPRTATARLASLLQESQKLIFEPFGLDNTKQDYFIAGSARLYLYPELQEVLKLKPIGDLDLVIPGKQHWQTLNTFLQNNPNPKIKQADVDEGRYIPHEYIEAFDEWLPKYDEEAVKDFSVRSTTDILKNSKLIDGYYYMSLYDIMDYKLNLNRDKEKQLTNLLINYQRAKNDSEKQEIKKYVLTLFSGDEEDAKDFLAPALARLAKQN